MNPSQRIEIATAIVEAVEPIEESLSVLVADAESAGLHAAAMRLRRMAATARTTRHGLRIQASKLRSQAVES